jgi:hypothetical protein
MPPRRLTAEIVADQGLYLAAAVFIELTTFGPGVTEP